MPLKKLFLACLIAIAPLASHCQTAGTLNPSTVSGEVLEVKDVAAYTYLRLKTGQGETWAAVSRSPVKKGDKVTIENVSVMENFESKSLNKTFKTIVFGDLGGTGKNTASAQTGMTKTTPEPGPIKVARAKGANAFTVAEVIAQAAKLKDKPVLVSGQVVKYNSSIMGKNWVHLQDGSGNAGAGTHDLLVTSMGTAKVGDVVTVAGTVRTDKDFGAGYSYKVLIEDASLKP